MERHRQCIDGESKPRGKKSRKTVENALHTLVSISKKDYLLPNICKDLETEEIREPSLHNQPFFGMGQVSNFENQFGNLLSNDSVNVPPDVFGEIFLFSPFENMETIERTKKCMEPNNGFHPQRLPITNFTQDFFLKVEENIRSR